MQSFEKRPILIVEDNLDDRLLLLTAFKQIGVKNPLFFINNGKEAQEYLFAAGDTIKIPCMVMLDLMLPDIRGLDLLKKLRANPRTRFIPIIVMTQSDSASDIRACYDAGANSYIQKASNFQEFEEKIRCVTHYWFGITQLPEINMA